MSLLVLVSTLLTVQSSHHGELSGTYARSLGAACRTPLLDREKMQGKDLPVGVAAAWKSCSLKTFHWVLHMCLVASVVSLDCSLPSSSVHGVLQARILEWVAMPSSGIFLTQRWNPWLLRLLHCRQILYPLSHLGRPTLGVSDS